MSEPLVSVILPMYNREKFVSTTIESVLHQTMQDFELIIMDDGSTDRSLEVAKDFERKDSRIRVLTQKNSGWVSTVNSLAKEVRGRYLANLDSDDIYLPQRLEWAISDFERYPDVIGTFCLAQTIDARGQLLHDPLLPRYLSDLIGKDLAQILVVANCLCMSSAVLKRSELDTTQPLLNAFSWVSDWDLWLRLASRGTLYRRKEFGVQWRKHDGNMSNEGYLQMLKFTLKTQEQHADSVIRYNNLGNEVWQNISGVRAKNHMELGNYFDAMVHLCWKNNNSSLTSKEILWLAECFILNQRKVPASELLTFVDDNKTLFSTEELSTRHRLAIALDGAL